MGGYEKQRKEDLGEVKGRRRRKKHKLEQPVPDKAIDYKNPIKIRVLVGVVAYISSRRI